jgi:transcriptional regulator with XRE-family HTH domain
MRTTKRHPRNKALADKIRDRLEELRREKGLNYTEFATAAGVPRPQYNAWRNSGVVPGGFYLRGMAEKLGVTTDWLLGIEDSPKYSEMRSREKMQEDMIAKIVRGLMTSPSPGVGGMGEEVNDVLPAALREGMVRLKAEKVQWSLPQMLGVMWSTEEDHRRFQSAFLAASLALELRRTRSAKGS